MPTNERQPTIGSPAADDPRISGEGPPGAPLSPRISIIMPVYNGERFLAETLASVQAQTMTDYELLLVDDGSTDDSLAIAEAHAARDPRIRVISLPHTGVVAARNHAISVARGPLIAIWDADDLCAPERLRLQADFLDANPDVGVLGSHAWHIGEQGRVVGRSDFGPVTRDEFFARKAQSAPVQVIGAMFRTDRALAVGCYDDRMPVAQDLDLWTRMSDDTVILTLPQRLYAYRVHADSASTRRFFEQMTLTGLIAENTARRRTGLEELSPEDWTRQMKAQPLRVRLERARTWHSRYLYRLAGGRLAAGRPSGAPCLALAALLAPLMVTRRLRTQLGSRRPPGNGAPAPREDGRDAPDPVAPVTPAPDACGADATAADASAPHVSIIVPVYNGERFLAETLASIQAQTMTDYELLLVDDGSTDGSLAIAEAHAARDPRVRILSLDHEGIVAARNRALEVARAPLIALWDGDDLCVPERLAVQLAFLDANPDVGVLGAYAWHIGEHGRQAGVAEFGPVTREEFAALRASSAPMFAVASSVVFRAGEARTAGGFRARMAPAEDADLWTRMSDRTVALILPQKLALYRVHAASSSTSRFFRQMALTELIAENAARRRGGRPEILPEEWERMLSARPMGERLQRARTWHSRRLYRIAGGMLADGRPTGALYLAGAAALAPAMVARRLRRQRRLRPQIALRLRRG